MDDQQRSISILIIACVMFFCFGFYLGIFSGNNIKQKEIIELSIELTKLEIQKLKGVDNT